LRFAEKLRQNGRLTELIIYAGSTHGFFLNQSLQKKTQKFEEDQKTCISEYLLADSQHWTEAEKNGPSAPREVERPKDLPTIVKL